MVNSEPEILSQGEVESPVAHDQQHKNNALSSIYSLTIDEFQNTICDGDKNFGSMNMDEFLNSIWTAEENQAVNNNNQNSVPNSSNDVNLSLGEGSSNKPIAKQPNLARQGSLTLPPPLCRKTVDEVWSEIHKTQRQGRKKTDDNIVQNSSSTPRQSTLGEMTLEDFLVQAGVVREQSSILVTPPPPRQPYGLYQSSNHPSTGGSTFVTQTPLTPSVAMTYPTMPHGGGGVLTDSSVYGKRNGAYHAPTVCYNGRMGNGGGCGPPQGTGVETSVSSVSPDGIGTSQADSWSRGQKRIADIPVEKVVERRQRRMIKNRESAARSRARKQAYTVELEAEMNQLRDENARLKEALADLERKRKQQQQCEEVKMRAQIRKQNAKRRHRAMRRTSSCPL